MIHPDCKQAIIDRARIDEVLGDFMSLKKAGVNYKGCCPFHNEKTPSFVVSPAKGIYKCFGCGKAGNAVGFVMEHEKMSFTDALKYIAKKYNIAVVETHLSDEEKQHFDLRESLQVVNSFANEYFANNLHNTADGKAIALSYFKERGFTEETIKQFQLGYCLEQKDAFTQAALAAGYKLEYLEKTGLTITADYGNVDRFRGRVMFPIHSLSGAVIGFGGRIVGANPDKKFAKYLNSPESEIYNKSKTLYGIYFARTEIAKQDQCILVEGYTDVISMHQAGVRNVVASSGTSLTVEQIRLIQKFTNNVLVVYDGDMAGIKAALRGINIILEQGMNVSVLLLPDGDDPDSFARKHSADELHNYIKTHKTDFITFKTQLFAGETQNDPIERAKLINDVVRTISLIPDPVTQMVYVEECSKILKISQDVLLKQLQKITQTAILQTHNRPQQQTPTPEQIAEITEQNDTMGIISTEKELLRLLIVYGDKTVDLPILPQPIHVHEYLHKEIIDGGMCLQQDVFPAMFREYFEHNLQQHDASQYFNNHHNQQCAAWSIDFVKKSMDMTLSGIWKKRQSAYETEEQKLSTVVWDTIATYKRKRLEDEYKALANQLKNPLSPEELLHITAELAKKKKTIQNITKELKHVV
ncbi:MAG: DNA primase [Bacteroidales bacterium]|jgi:DNA primase|nr:DNA primase [Bacteroidales bacterium]